MNKEIEIPRHIAIIMDGNGRWATQRGYERSAGHLEGSKAFERMVSHAFRIGVQVLSVYAFSTDNFKRSEKEVAYLMNLFITFFKRKMKVVMDNNIRIVFSGEKKGLREDVLEAMESIVQKTEKNERGVLNICLNYGGQEEIVDATKKIVNAVHNGEVRVEDLDKVSFYEYLYADLPPVDLVIRTSGEERLSNFMLYQSAYAELYFTDVLFPDFKESDFDEAIECYNKRTRRFGSA